MKNILVPTDFSPNAQLATHFAATLAQQAAARLVLLHVWSPMAVSGEEASNEEVIQQQLDTAAHALFLQHQLSVTRLLKPGYPQEEIPLIAERVQADLVVMGAKGFNHQAAPLISSLGLALLQACPCPLICLPTAPEQPLVAAAAPVFPIDARFCNASGLLLLQQYNSLAVSRKIG